VSSAECASRVRHPHYVLPGLAQVLLPPQRRYNNGRNTAPSMCLACLDEAFTSATMTRRQEHPRSDLPALMLPSLLPPRQQQKQRQRQQNHPQSDLRTLMRRSLSPPRQRQKRRRSDNNTLNLTCRPWRWLCFCHKDNGRSSGRGNNIRSTQTARKNPKVSSSASAPSTCSR